MLQLSLFRTTNPSPPNSRWAWKLATTLFSRALPTLWPCVTSRTIWPSEVCSPRWNNWKCGIFLMLPNVPSLPPSSRWTWRADRAKCKSPACTCSSQERWTFPSLPPVIFNPTLYVILLYYLCVGRVYHSRSRHDPLCWSWRFYKYISCWLWSQGHDGLNIYFWNTIVFSIVCLKSIISITSVVKLTIIITSTLF